MFNVIVRFQKEVMLTGWILFGLAVAYLLYRGMLYTRSHRKRNHLCAYAILLLLSDEMRQDQKDKLLGWIQQSNANDPAKLMLDARVAIENVADMTCRDAGLSASAALWKAKKDKSPAIP